LDISPPIKIDYCTQRLWFMSCGWLFPAWVCAVRWWRV